jgi:hypothetical protein
VFPATSFDDGEDVAVSEVYFGMFPASLHFSATSFDKGEDVAVSEVTSSIWKKFFQSRRVSARENSFLK